VGRWRPPGVVPEATRPGQESVWDYPRPPRVEPATAHVVVRFGGAVVCDTTRALRVLETSHPPTYYLPVADWAPGALEPAAGGSVCEYKGPATYLTVVGGDGQRAEAAAWTYPKPWPGYQALRDHVAVYPDRMDECTVDGEVVRGQDGGFYGGWITSAVAGPFEGGPGTRGW
jgi:uncharacterized protein (DUF427 family)